MNVKVIGRGNVPKKGAFLFVSNHCSYFDPPLLGTSIYRSLNYMARDTLFKTACSNWVMRRLNAFPVKRGNADLAAVKESLRILKDNRPLVMFPEGTRSKDKELKRGKPGAGFIVSKAHVPVVPAYIEGSFDALPHGISTLKRHPVRVIIGEPMTFSPESFVNRDRETYQRISDEIMAKISELGDTHK